MRADEVQLRAWMLGGLDGVAADHACLLRALAPLLTAFYRRRVAGGDEIEDLVQETLIAVHTRRATYDRDRAFTARLFAIARYKMIDHFRRNRHTVPIEGLEEMLVAEGFEAASSARLDVDDLLESLPDKQAHLIRATILRFTPTLDLHPATTNAAAIWSALVAGETPPAAEFLLDEAVVLVWRQDLASLFRTIDAAESNAIRLACAGTPFRELCATLVEAHGAEDGVVLAGGFLGRWLADGLIVGIMGHEQCDR